MTDDWGLWLYAGLMTGIVYAGAVVLLNGHGRYGKYGLRLAIAEALVGLVLAGSLVCGLTGQWWIAPIIGLAYLTLGGPMVVALIIAGVMAREYERGEIDKITGNDEGATRDTFVCSRNGLGAGEPGDRADTVSQAPTWVERNVRDGFNSVRGKPGRN